MPEHRAIYEFGPFRLEAAERRLLQGGEPVKLRAKVFDTLRVLVENHGGLVGKEELMKAVWPDTVVEEGNLAHNITVLRKALADAPGAGQFIETVPGQGYRFVAPVRTAGQTQQFAPSSYEERLQAARASLTGSGRIGVSPGPSAEAVVGRDRELDDLAAALHSAVRGGGLVMCMAGEPGIGKSTLFRRFLEREGSREEYAVATGRCSELLAESEAYLPVLEAIESLMEGPGGPAVAELLKLLAPTWYVQVAPLWAATDPSFAAIVSDAKAASRERMKRELGTFLDDISRFRPLVLFLDDVHWADAATTDVVAYLAQRIGRSRMLLVAAYRASDMQLTNHPFIAVRQELQKQNLCREIKLAPLTHRDVAAYLSTELPERAGEARFVDMVYARTEGHPLFLADLVRLYRDGMPEIDLESDLPASVRNMIDRRIARLDAQDVTCLAAASIQGAEFDSLILADTLRLDPADVEEHLDRLERVHAFVRRGSEREFSDGSVSMVYGFAHALYQHAVEESLMPNRRASLSLAAAESLLRHEGRPGEHDTARLAFLFETGRDFERAADFFIQASANAARLFANEEAVRLGARAIACAERLEGEARDRRVLAASQQVAQLQLVLSRFPEAIASFAQAEAAAKALEDVDAWVNAICAGGVAQFNSRRMEVAREYAQRAMAIAQAAGSELGAAAAGMVLGLERMCAGEVADAEEHFSLAVPVLREKGAPLHALEAVGFAGLLHAWQLDHKNADYAVNWTLQHARERGLPYHVVMNLFVRGISRLNRGNLSDGFEDLWEGLRMAEKNRERYWLSRFPNTLGWAYREFQDFETALKFDAEGAQTAHESGYTKPEAYSHVNLAHDYLMLGEPDRAVEHLDRAEEIFGRDVWFRWRYSIRVKAEYARYWLAKGDPAKAQAYAEESLQLATPRKTRKHIAWAHKLMGDVATVEERGEDARLEYDTALTLLGQYRCPVIEWRVLAAAAESAAKRRDRELATEYRGRCRQVIESLADSIADETLRTRFLKSDAIRRALA